MDEAREFTNNVLKKIADDPGLAALGFSLALLCLSISFAIGCTAVIYVQKQAVCLELAKKVESPRDLPWSCT